MIDPEVQARLDEILAILSPPVIAGSPGMPPSPLERWNSSEVNRLWLASLLGHPTWRLAVEVVLYLRRAQWGVIGDGADAVVKGSIAYNRLEGLNDFTDQLLTLCLPPQVDPGPMREDSDEEVIAWAKQSGLYHEPAQMPKHETETAEEPTEES